MDVIIINLCIGFGLFMLGMRAGEVGIKNVLKCEDDEEDEL